MKKYILQLLILLFFLFLGNIPFGQAANFPFTDVKQDTEYYPAVKSLFDAGIISDDGSHLFHPDALMNRDFFVMLVVSV